MPKTKEQNEEIKKQRRNQIMLSALEVFSHKGFHLSTIADIARHAGISKGLIYNYFTSKNELLKNILLEGFYQLIEGFDTNHDDKLSHEEFLYFINTMFDKIETNKLYWKLYFSVSFQPNIWEDDILESLEAISKPKIAILLDYFRNAGYSSPMLEMVYFKSLLDGIFLNFLYNDKNYPFYEIKAMVLERYQSKLSK